MVTRRVIHPVIWVCFAVGILILAGFSFDKPTMLLASDRIDATAAQRTSVIVVSYRGSFGFVSTHQVGRDAHGQPSVTQLRDPKSLIGTQSTDGLLAAARPRLLSKLRWHGFSCTSIAGPSAGTGTWTGSRQWEFQLRSLLLPYWSAVALLLAPLMVAWIRSRTRLKRLARNCCSSCGYPCFNITSLRCPECGAAIWVSQG